MAKRVEIKAGGGKTITIKLSGKVTPRQGLLLAAKFNGTMATHNSLLGMAPALRESKIHAVTGPVQP